MTRKIITGIIAAVLVVTIAVFAAEKVKEKVRAEKPIGGERGERFEKHEGLLDKLAEAYKAKDREKMGEIINKMQERREKMREFVKANRWHRWAHHRMMMMRQMGPGWGQGPQMAGPGWKQGCLPYRDGQATMAGPRCEQFGAMKGRGCCGCDNMMGNCGPMAGGAEQMPCQQPGMGMGACGQQYGQRMPMRGWGRGFQREWNPGPDADNMGPQEWNTPRRERQNVPPPEWGW